MSIDAPVTSSGSIPARPRRRQAFTLTELLIVIAIIVILIAMLIPALGRAREMGRITKCLANQRSPEGRQRCNSSCSPLAPTTTPLRRPDPRPRAPLAGV